MDYFLSGWLLRCSQIVVDASIWIAFGCFISAIFRYMIGAEKTRSLFGNDSRYGLVIGWAVGMLLPVCSLGVIPVVRELHRVGVKPGTIIAFGLTAPLFNPLSILYGLSLPNPFAVLIFSAAAMLIVTGMGAIWGKVFGKQMADSPLQDSESPIPSTGLRRSIAVLQGASGELIGWSAVFMAIGIIASGTIAALVPHGSLQGETEPDKMFAPVFMAGYVAPIYSTPLLAMSQIGGMFQHGNSIGAAFSLLILGAGVNVGVLVWFAIAFGFRKVLWFAGLLFTLTVVFAYAMDKPLYPEGVAPQGHTHAFDIYTHPYPATEGEYLNKAIAEIKQDYEDRGFSGSYFLVLLVVVGVGFNLVGRVWDLAGWYQQKRETQSKLDITLPSWLIGVVACVGLVVLSVVGTYVYYPDSKTVLGDLSMINAECVVAAKTGEPETVSKLAVYCDDLSRRLEVGTLLRTGGLSEFKRAKAKVYRDKLNLVRDNIAVGQTSNIDSEAMDLHRAFQQMRKAFREE